jgi:ribosomal protein L40E
VKEVTREVHYVERPPETPRVVETQRVIERVLVICPFCGAKNEQGAPKCANCGAQL